MSLPTLPRGGYTFIYGVIAAGALTIGYSGYAAFAQPIAREWLVLAALTLLTGSFSVKIPSVAARISVSDAFVFTAVLLYGPAPGTLIVSLDSFILSLWLKASSRQRLRSAFNVCAAALALWVSATLFFRITGVTPGDLDSLLPLEARLLELFGFACVYFLLNSGLVAVALAFEKRRHPAHVWREHFPWFVINYLGGISVAALLVSYSKSLDLRAIAIILPLLLISYLTYRTSLGRIDDARKHVEQLSDLYMSAIETLAMAVDAKDQITHGHIRRVQVYACELASRLGVRDENQMKAIQAAALLHDMGKLAIPEHILNKPGKLTAAEFERMKQHAALGADLLSSISFPYPVVPIVRHHHENWDGTGYPTGVAGTDIPLGARILSVVDCFDALTSDRPYRPRLTTDEAFDVLRERRGSMYDPLIVDAFIDAYADIAPHATKAGNEARSFVSLDVPDASPLHAISASASETVLFDDLEAAVTKCTSLDAAFELSAQTLKTVAPGEIFCLYVLDVTTGVLQCRAASGEGSNVLNGYRIEMGKRVSGWCAANERPAINSTASLDIGQIVERFDAPLKSCLAVPIIIDGRLTAVLTGYASKLNGYAAGDVYAFERVGRALSLMLAGGSESARVLHWGTKTKTRT